MLEPTRIGLNLHCAFHRQCRINRREGKTLPRCSIELLSYLGLCDCVTPSGHHHRTALPIKTLSLCRVHLYAGPMGSCTPSSSFNRLDVSPEQLASEDDQLIVAMPYEKLVARTLDKLRSGVVVTKTESDEDLQLSLLHLRGSLQPEFLQRIQRWFPELPTLVPEDTVGVLISSIKCAIGSYSGGWSPTMGRNRLVGHLTATDGRVISDEDPVPVVSPYGTTTLADLVQQATSERQQSTQESKDGKKPGVRIGIADTPLWDHEWFRGAKITHIGPYPEPAPLKERAADNPFRTAHSTFVTGLVLGEAPTAEIIVSGVLDSDGVGKSWEVAKAIVALGKEKIDILNLSFVCYTGDAEPPLALATAIDRLDPEIVVVAGAGNYGARVDFVESYPGGKLVNLSVAPAWPAALDDVIAVGSSIVTAPGVTTRRADFSPNAAWVDILAPGDPVVSTFADGLFCSQPATAGPSTSFARWNGTSFSTAIVTGLIAKEMAKGAGKSAREAWREIRDHGLAPGLSEEKVLNSALVPSRIIRPAVPLPANPATAEAEPAAEDPNSPAEPAPPDGTSQT